MATMTTGEADALWSGVDDQRTRTANLLEQLTPEQLEHPSLCEGWTVRHVAAHLTLQQQGYRDVAAFVARNPQMLRHLGLNATIHHSALILAEQMSVEENVARIRAMVGSRRHNAFVTPYDALSDTLVHGQDIAVPLGLELPMRPEVAVMAATRLWAVRHSWISAVYRRLPLDDHRLTATDADWTRGQGPAVEGPIGALVLLLSGRRVALDQLSGPGADSLRTA
jgi:uncharacterized protein (TIGR03083 family)